MLKMLISWNSLVIFAAIVSVNGSFSPDDPVMIFRRPRNDGLLEFSAEFKLPHDQYVDRVNWTIPNGAILLPGSSMNGYTSSNELYDLRSGRTMYKLVVSNTAKEYGEVLFKGSAANRWSNTPGWQGSAKFSTSKPATKTAEPSVTGRVEISHHPTGWNYVRDAKFVVTVKGGQPKPDIYEWTLPYGQKITPGQRSGNYYAKPPTTNADGSQTFILEIANNAQFSLIRFEVASSTNHYSVAVHS